MKILKLLLFIFVPFILSLIIFFIIKDYSIFYNSLNKPINLKPIVFPIVWTILYIIIGIATFIVYQKKKVIYKSYFLDIFFNITWSLIFFGLENLNLTLIWTILLTILVFINMIKYFKISKISGILYLLYFIWVLFALGLTIGIRILN